MLKTVCLAIVFLAGRVSALDAHRDITQFVHTSWTEKDGAPENARALAQTTDGYLWIGTATGLFHFDGVHFARFDPPGEASPFTTIRGLLATRDGSLWVTEWYGGLSRVRKGHVTSYSERDGMPGAFSIAEKSDGSLIAGTKDGLRIFRNDRWEVFGKEWMLPGKSAQQVYYDRGGTLWVVTDDRVVYLPLGGHSFIDPDEKVPPIAARYKFAQAPDGEVWLAVSSRSAHVVRRTRAEKDRATEVRVGAGSILFDRSGSIWIGSLGDGLRRVRFPERIRGIHVARFGSEAEKYTAKDGLSADTVYSLLEDHEGNIWCATGRGIDRLRERSFVPVAIAQPDTTAFIKSTADGLLWTFSLSGGVSFVAPDGTQTAVNPFPMYAAATDRSGSVWTAVSGLDRMPGGGEEARTMLFHSVGGKLAHVHLPNARSLKDISSLTIDSAGTLWLLDSRRGLFRLANGHLNGVLAPSENFDGRGVLFADHLDRIWLGQTGRIVLCANGTSRSFESTDGVPAGQTYTFHEDAAGSIWAGGEAGISKFDGARFRLVPSPAGQPFKSVSGIAEDKDGFWWLASALGILRMPAGEMNRALADPARPASYTLFNSFDGLPGKSRYGYPVPVMARTADGRIWCATTHGLAWVDPGSLRKNDIPPPVVVQAARVNGKPVTLTSRDPLPPLRVTSRSTTRRLA